MNAFRAPAAMPAAARKLRVVWKGSPGLSVPQPSSTRAGCCPSAGVKTLSRRAPSAAARKPQPTGEGDQPGLDARILWRAPPPPNAPRVNAAARARGRRDRVAEEHPHLGGHVEICPA